MARRLLTYALNSLGKIVFVDDVAKGLDCECICPCCKEKLMAKNGNEWYIATVTPAGATNEEDRAFALELYKSFRNTIQDVNFDVEDTSSESTSGGAAPDLDKTEF